MNATVTGAPHDCGKTSVLPLPASTAQFKKMLTRNVPYPLSPEIHLIIAVIGQAWLDAHIGGLDCGPSAVIFFRRGRADALGRLIGLSPGFVSDQFRKHHPVYGMDAIAKRRDQDLFFNAASA